MTTEKIDKNDELTRARFEAYMKLSGEMGDGDDSAGTSRERLRLAADRLEAKFSGRGLRFTQVFSGAMPVQAFGVIDGMRFYFRFRHDVAALRVGDLDPSKPARDLERKNKASEKQNAILLQNVADGDMDEDEARRWIAINERRAVVEVPNGIDDYPTLIKKESIAHGVLGQQWAGTLTADEAESIFARLVDELGDVSRNLDTGE